MENKDMKAIAEFLFESGMLKIIDRNGWNTVHAPRESVAEHTYRTVLVGYVLAKMAELSKEEELLLLKACVFHDLHEARLGDLNKISRRYIKADEERAEKEQREKLPAQIREDVENSLALLSSKIKEYVFDADKIECAITAKEYLDLGYKTEVWIENTEKILKTKEGKALFSIIKKTNSLEWLEKERKK
ncbi:MAG: HD domain-containing protein [Candidatus Micrarchaeota archaeon]